MDIGEKDMFADSPGDNVDGDYDLKLSRSGSEMSQFQPFTQVENPKVNNEDIEEKVKNDLHIMEEPSDSDEEANKVEVKALEIEVAKEVVLESKDDGIKEKESVEMTKAEGMKIKIKECKEISAKEMVKKDLKLKKRKLQEDVEEARENKWKRKMRVDGKKKILSKQQADLIKQEEIIQDIERKKTKKWSTEKMNNQITDIKKKVITLGENATRLLKRSVPVKKNVILKIDTLAKLRNSKKTIVVFYPGSNTVDMQSKEVKEELNHVKNLKLIASKGMEFIATELKNFNSEEDREDIVGVVMVKWDGISRADPDDAELIGIESKKLMNILELVTSRGKTKFGDFVLVLPPVIGQNENILEDISHKVEEEFNREIEVISMTGEIDSDIKDVMSNEDNEVAFCGFIFRRGLSEVVIWMNGGDQDEICSKCGFLNHGEGCSLEVAVKKEASTEGD